LEYEGHQVAKMSLLQNFEIRKFRIFKESNSKKPNNDEYLEERTSTIHRSTAAMKGDTRARRKKIKGKEAKAKNPLNPKRLNNLSKQEARMTCKTSNV
jgi:hypothetical protein